MKERTYRYFTGQPLYTFGYGLSYSKFSYSHLKLFRSTLNAGDSLNLSVDVKNGSTRGGDEVVELYLEFPKVAGAPIQALRGFQRVHLAPGEGQQVRFRLDSRDLSLVDESGQRTVASGSYRLTVGGGLPRSRAPSVAAGFTIRGQQNLPD